MEFIKFRLVINLWPLCSVLVSLRSSKVCENQKLHLKVYRNLVDSLLLDTRWFLWKFEELVLWKNRNGYVDLVKYLTDHYSFINIADHFINFYHSYTLTLFTFNKLTTKTLVNQLTTKTLVNQLTTAVSLN